MSDRGPPEPPVSAQRPPEPPVNAQEEPESPVSAQHPLAPPLSAQEEPPMGDTSPPEIAFHEIVPAVPSFMGVLAITLAGFLLTLLALFVISDWDPENIPSDVIIDVAVVALTYWVDMRAALAWRRLIGVRRHEQG
jgi:hypothetical protein